MKTMGVRLYGENDLRLEEFELPAIADDEILVENVSDSICMSSYKAAIQGTRHKRVPADIAINPVVIGHEYCGRILKVGKKWQDRFHEGERFGIQPAINLPGSMYTPGYAYMYCGGDMTFSIIDRDVLNQDCLLHFDGSAYFYGSLAEPLSCIIGAFHAQYHTERGSYVHSMGIVNGGSMAILAGAGPMGLGAIDYAINADRRPSLLVVTDVNEARLKRAASIYTAEMAMQHGVKLIYKNTSTGDAARELRELSGGRGFDDVFVFAPVPAVIEQADAILAFDGCLNFFAGPTDTGLSARFNFYNVHYSATHIVGTSGGNTEDMIEALDMMSSGRLNPAGMITHVGGLDSVAETTLNLPGIPGGKKLCYTHISMPMTAIDDFAEKGKEDPLFARLAEICRANNGLWCAQAEEYLLANGRKIDH